MPAPDAENSYGHSVQNCHCRHQLDNSRVKIEKAAGHKTVSMGARKSLRPRKAIQRPNFPIFECPRVQKHYYRPAETAHFAFWRRNFIKSYQKHHQIEVKRQIRPFWDGCPVDKMRITETDEKQKINKRRSRSGFGLRLSLGIGFDI